MLPSWKKVAWAPYFASTCRIFGVQTGSGPSSKLKKMTFLSPAAAAAVGLPAGTPGVPEPGLLVPVVGVDVGGAGGGCGDWVVCGLDETAGLGGVVCPSAKAMSEPT